MDLPKYHKIIQEKSFPHCYTACLKNSILNPSSLPETNQNKKTKWKEINQSKNLCQMLNKRNIPCVVSLMLSSLNCGKLPRGKTLPKARPLLRKLCLHPWQIQFQIAKQYSWLLFLTGIQNLIWNSKWMICSSLIVHKIKSLVAFSKRFLGLLILFYVRLSFYGQINFKNVAYYATLLTRHTFIKRLWEVL